MYAGKADRSGAVRCGCGGDNGPQIEAQIQGSKTALGRPQWDFKVTNNERQTIYVTLAIGERAGNSAACKPGEDFDTPYRDVEIKAGDSLKLKIPAEGNGVTAGAPYRISVRNCKGTKIGDSTGNFPAKCG